MEEVKYENSNIFIFDLRLMVEYDLRRKGKPAMTINIKLSEELVRAIDEAAGPLARNEYMANVLAEHLGRPELAEIPRKRMGRPRKPQPAAS